MIAYDAVSSPRWIPASQVELQLAVIYAVVGFCQTCYNGNTPCSRKPQAHADSLLTVNTDRWTLSTPDIYTHDPISLHYTTVHASDLTIHACTSISAMQQLRQSHLQTFHGQRSANDPLTPKWLVPLLPRLLLLLPVVVMVVVVLLL
jgi:hypothetical protein